MGMKKHVEYSVHICNQRTYLLTRLKRQGLPPAQLQNVSDTIILARILYALPAWRGYMNASDINSFKHLFLKAQRWQLITTNYDVTKLFENWDVALFINKCKSLSAPFISKKAATCTQYDIASTRT